MVLESMRKYFFRHMIEMDIISLVSMIYHYN